MKPLVVDLFCGLGGWAEGFLDEGYNVVGFDNERRSYPAQLVLQDVLTLHGSQFRDATVIVASPPCQNYSYLAMPWSRSKDPNNSKAAKALRRKWETEGPDNRLFDACFRIQREAIEATRRECPRCGGFGNVSTGIDKNCHLTHAVCGECAGAGTITRYIPLIVENVRGAQPWVGRSAWNYGSFHLWGDVPALMPINLRRGKGAWNNHTRGVLRRDDSVEFGDGQKVPAYSDPRRNGGRGVHLTSPAENEAGTKIGGDWFRDPACHSKHGSKSNARKAASAQIAKIPFELARHIAAVYYPR